MEDILTAILFRRWTAAKFPSTFVWLLIKNQTRPKNFCIHTVTTQRLIVLGMLFSSWKNLHFICSTQQTRDFRLDGGRSNAGGLLANMVWLVLWSKLINSTVKLATIPFGSPFFVCNHLSGNLLSRWVPDEFNAQTRSRGHLNGVSFWFVTRDNVVSHYILINTISNL